MKYYVPGDPRYQVMRREHDVVVVGSGSSALTAALAAACQGASVVVLEKSSKFGGSSALSGGQLWLPNNRLAKEARIHDSVALARKYLVRLSGGRTDFALIDAFIHNAPRALDFLEKETPLSPELRANVPDYHPEWEGASKGGRTVDPGLFEGELLGPYYRRILHNPQYHLRGGVHLKSAEFEKLMRGEPVPELDKRSPSVLALGEALVGGLAAGILRRKVTILLSHKVVRLLRRGKRIVGAEALVGGKKIRFHARKGVVLAAGGFEWSTPMKKRYLSAQSENSAGCPSNTGDGIRMGIEIGGATSLMDEAWWFTLLLRPGDRRGWLVTSERTLPGSIMVNRGGKRFTNEAMNYLDVARDMLFRDSFSYEFPNIPSFLIFDSEYRRRYPIAGLAPSKTARGWLARGRTLRELAENLGISPGGLGDTVARFNANARRGEDPDFGRGTSLYDRHWGDPRAGNPTLGTLDTSPFFGVRILAGDIGTKGGLRTDARARVLNANGEAITGLYSAGNNAASVMGVGYAGSGATLGPCVTFGYLAGMNICRNG